MCPVRIMYWLALLVIGSCAGCWGPSNPYTELKVNPITKTFSFYDNKDNDVTIEGLEIDGDTKSGKLASMTLVNAASPVRLANVEQLNAYTEQVKVVTQAMTNMIQVLPEVLTGVADIVRELKTLRLAISADLRATTQPAE